MSIPKVYTFRNFRYNGIRAQIIIRHFRTKAPILKVVKTRFVWYTVNMAIKGIITKRLYVKFTRCRRAARYEANDPGAAKLSLTVQQRRQETRELAYLARELFPGGEEAGSDADAYETLGKLADKTVRLLAEGKTIYDGVFLSKNFSCVFDIAVPGEDGVNFYCVKCATAPSENYVRELAYLAHVAKLSGLKVAKTALIVVDPHYTLGKQLKASALLRKIDLTKRVGKYAEKVAKNCEELAFFVQKNDMPDAALCANCERQFGCEYFSACFGKWLDKPSLFTVHGVDAATRYRLYSEGKISFDDLKAEMPSLKPKAAGIIKAYEEKAVYVDKNALAKFLGGLWYPMCFLDFESLQSAIPRYKGTRPLETVAFQYSLHVIEKEGDAPVHYGYIAKEGEDAREIIADRLAKEIPQNACILAFGKFLECKVLGQLAQMFPHVRAKLGTARNNVRDIGAVFSNDTVYYGESLGSRSLKTIYRCVDPAGAHGYEVGAVHNGADAMATYLMLPYMSEEERKARRAALWEYCKLDTLSMITILEDIRKRV